MIKIYCDKCGKEVASKSRHKVFGYDLCNKHNDQWRTSTMNIKDFVGKRIEKKGQFPCSKAIIKNRNSTPYFEPVG